MKGHRILGLLAALAACVIFASTAKAAKGSKKANATNVSVTVRGQVVGMHTDPMGVAMTIKVHHHRKLGAASTQHHGHRTFQLTNATRVDRVTTAQHHQPS